MASEPEVAAGLPCRGREHQRCLRLAILGLGYSECRDRSGKGVEEGGGGAPETTLETRGAQTPQKSALHHGEEREALMDLPSRSRLCPWPKRDSPSPPPPPPTP